MYFSFYSNDPSIIRFRDWERGRDPYFKERVWRQKSNIVKNALPRLMLALNSSFLAQLFCIVCCGICEIVLYIVDCSGAGWWAGGARNETKDEREKEGVLFGEGGIGSRFLGKGCATGSCARNNLRPWNV